MCVRRVEIALSMLQEEINANLVGLRNACKLIWRKKVSHGIVLYPDLCVIVATWRYVINSKKVLIKHFFW